MLADDSANSSSSKIGASYACYPHLSRSSSLEPICKAMRSLGNLDTVFAIYTVLLSLKKGALGSCWYTDKAPQESMVFSIPAGF